MIDVPLRRVLDLVAVLGIGELLLLLLSEFDLVLLATVGAILQECSCEAGGGKGRGFGST
jgi:hypothetical protein